MSDAERLFAEGQLEEAVGALEGLVNRLQTEGLVSGEHAAFQIGTTYAVLGQILDVGRQPERAIVASQRAIKYLEKESSDAAQGNLASAFGNQASALGMLGRYAEALEAAERGVVLNEGLGRYRNAACGPH